MANVSYKVTLYNDSEDSEEIRRFQLPCNLNTNVTFLSEKILSFYPASYKLRTISWIDNDGDNIKVDQNEDLENAVKDANDNGTVKLKAVVYKKLDSETNPVLSSLVYTAQSLGIDPTSCNSCESSRSNAPTTVLSYLARLMAGVSLKATKSLIVMGSIGLISVLSMILPNIITSTLIFIIVAASMGLPMATTLLGHLLFLFISLSPSYVVTILSVWALRTMMRTKKNYFLVKNLEYWNKVLDDIINKDIAMKKHQREIKDDVSKED